MRRLNSFLAIGIAGVVALLAGLSWDALAHAADSHLVENEHLFTLANPAHATLLAGVGMVVVGVVGALDASLRASATRWSSPRRRRATSGAAAVLVAASLTVAGWAVTRPLPSPGAVAAAAGDVAGADGHHGADDTDVVLAATTQQMAEADALVTATRLALAIAGYEDVSEAEAAGYRPVQAPTSGLVHYVHPTHLASPAVLDPAAPESLVYLSTPDGPVLEAAMYILPSVESPVPDVGGLAAHWHAHDDLCFSTTTAMIMGTTNPDGSCPPGARNQATPPMLHVWTIDHPEGPFAGP
ncbi:MAG TPA: hypothetical protein VGV63_02610 [Acidimicrobiales bacterium]|nr:hypothetical protein [Acidimicrobiales bacterium]